MDMNNPSTNSSMYEEMASWGTGQLKDKVVRLDSDVLPWFKIYPPFINALYPPVSDVFIFW